MGRRQLAAIMFTDIVGYTALMGKDEQKALEILRLNLSIQNQLAEKHGGSLVKELGDGTLLSFPTASQAVECAVALQEQSREKDISLRVGIHVGEVVFEEEDVFGDGVNIASRLEQIAPRGGIAVSGAVYDNIRNKVSVSFQNAGNRKLKNVEGEIRVFIHGDPIPESAEVKTTAQTGQLAEKKGPFSRYFWIFIVFGMVMAILYGQPWQFFKPERETSVAVLPFNVIGASDHAISDALQEQILHDLSGVSEFKLSSLTSTQRYRDSDLAAIEIAEELDVSHILEGTMRVTESRVRISSRLIEASQDDQIWSIEFEGDRSTEEQFIEDIARKISDYIKLTLDLDGENIPTASIEAYDLYLQAEKLAEQGLPGQARIALGVAREALAMDPDFAGLHALIGWIYTDMVTRYGEDAQLYDSAVYYCRKAIQLDPESIPARVDLGFALWHRDGAEVALPVFRKVRSLGSYAANNIMGTISMYQGQYDSAYYYYREKLQHDRNDPLTLMRLGELFSAVNLYDSADHYFEEAYLRDRDLTDLKVKFIELSLQRGDLQSAKKYIASFLPEGSSEEVLQNTRDLFLAVIATREGDWEEAYRIMQRDSFHGVLEAWILLMNGQGEKARSLFMTLLATYESDRTVTNKMTNYLSRASCEAALGQTEAALGSLANAVYLNYADYDGFRNSIIYDYLPASEEFKTLVEQIRINRENARNEVLGIASQLP